MKYTLSNSIQIRLNFKICLFILFVFNCYNKIYSQSNDSIKIASLEQAISLLKGKNVSLRNAQVQTQLAELTKKTALGNILNPRVPASAQALNNLQLQTSFLPAEAFGGRAGTFKEVTLGQQYVSTFVVQPQFDIINLASIAQVKSADINLKLVEIQNKIAEQNLYDKLNATYFYILSFQAQINILKENILVSKDILKVTKNKFMEGIVKQQDVNESEVNLLTLQDKLEQLEWNLQLQLQIFALFYENRIAPSFLENVWNYEALKDVGQSQNNLQTENSHLLTLSAKQELLSLRYQHIPVLSFQSAINWQNLSNDNFFASNSRWINYNYIGLKVTWDVPNIQKLSNSKSKYYQLKILENNDEHSVFENSQKNLQLLTEYSKAKSQLINFQNIVKLRTENYEKSIIQYKENVLPIEKLLQSQNDLLLSKLNLVMTLANIGFSKSRIDISNKF